MNLNEVYKSLSDYERLTLLAAFGLPPDRTWVTKTKPNGPRETLNADDIPSGGVQPLIGLLEKKLIRNLGILGDDAFKILSSPRDQDKNQFVTTCEGNLIVLAILQTEYGYDTQPDWLEQD